MKYTELNDCEEFYHKVEYYNKTKTEQLSYHYKEILKLLAKTAKDAARRADGRASEFGIHQPKKPAKKQ